MMWLTVPSPSLPITQSAPNKNCLPPHRLNREQALHILVVEDNPGDVRLIEEALKEGVFSHLVSRAADGMEALRLIRPEGGGGLVPDLILLDLNLPGMDGRELLREIKATPHLRRVPVIVLSSSKADEDVLRTYELHANAYVTKPVQVDDFIRTIRSLEEFWTTVARLPTRLESANRA
jgi:two-component system, chemotaxis family, response regulator Rcp1